MSRAIRRFYYVRTKQGKALHITYQMKVEGATTLCGKVIDKDWLWCESRKSELPYCRTCVA